MDPRAKPLVKAPRQAMRTFGRIRADTLTGMAFPISLHSPSFSPRPRPSTRPASPALQPPRKRPRRCGRSQANLLSSCSRLASSGPDCSRCRCWPARWLTPSARHANGRLGSRASLARRQRSMRAWARRPSWEWRSRSLRSIRSRLYWTAVINGLVAVPVMVVMMLMTAQQRVMGQFTVNGWLRWLGWAATCAMAVCALRMIVGWIVGAPP